MKKILSIFNKDLRIMSRDFISAYILISPVLFALIINAIAPSINDTSVNLGLLNDAPKASIEYLKQFANVDVFDTREQLDKRIKQRDDFIGLIKKGDNYEIIAEGDEFGESEKYAKLLATFDVAGISFEDTSVSLKSFGLTTPPMKRILVNGGLMFIAVLGGMLILVSIIEEKADNTISAMNLTTVSRAGFIAGKSIIGVLYPIIGSILLLFITGFAHINFMQLLLVMLALCALSGVIGMIMGLTSDDVMTAGGNMKLLFLPLMLSVAAAEMLSPFWQRFFYWSPFYWAYKANDIVLTGDNNWSSLVAYSGIVVLISLIIVAALAPKIRKGLMHS